MNYTRNNIEWDLLVGGKSVKDLGIASYIKSISTSTIDGFLSKIGVSIFSPLVKDNSLSKDLFGRGRLVTFYCGWEKQEYIATGVIESVEFSVADQAIMFNAYDKGKELAREEKDTVYKNLTDSAIAIQIAMKYGFVPVVEETKPTVSRVQSHLTDYRFLHTLAMLNGYVFYTCFNAQGNRWELHFEKPKVKTQTSLFSFDYSAPNSDVILFNIDMSGKESNPDYTPKPNQQMDTTQLREETEIRLQCYLAEEKKEKIFTKNVVGRKGVEIFTGNFQNEKEAQAFIDKTAREREESWVHGELTVVGNPKIKTGEIIQVKGITFMFFPSLDGYWRIEGVGHHLYPQDSVFSTSMELVRVASGG